MNYLKKNIVDALQNSTSDKPMNVKDLYQAIDSKAPFNMDAFNAELDQLYEQKVINRCYIEKGDFKGHVYWPTAKSLQSNWRDFNISPKKPELPPVRRSELIKPKEPIMKVPKFTATAIVQLALKSEILTIEQIINKLNYEGIDEYKKAKDMVKYCLKIKALKIDENNFIFRGENETWLKKNGFSGPLAFKVPDNATHDLLIQPILSQQTFALDKQEGGNHYKQMKIQPVEYIVANNLGFIEGNIIKYISRYKNKNGIEDLRKAQHFIEMLIEQQASLN